MPYEDVSAALFTLNAVPISWVMQLLQLESSSDAGSLLSMLGLELLWERLPGELQPEGCMRILPMVLACG